MMRISTALFIALLTAGASTAEPLAFRGTAGPLPFWFGTTLYDTAWTGYAGNDRSTDWWWFDKEHWRLAFGHYKEARLNTMVFWHPHPYVGFCRLAEFPEAAYLSAEEMDRQVEMFRWITAEGKRHGVSIYFLTWNVCLPPGMRKAHKLDEFGADTPLVRKYTRSAVAEMFRTYPDLGGLITMAAEAPPRCVGFVAEAIVPGLKDSVEGDSPRKTLPCLIFWTWCSYPEDAKRILDDYPGEKHVLHYLQYEQYFKPMADPRILMTSRAVGEVKVVAMGGPGGAYFWGDPFFVQKTMQDLAAKNGSGIFFQGTDYLAWIAERWIAREAFERYSFDPQRIDPRSYWEDRIRERYGSREIAAPLLTAMVDSTNIFPRFICLVHSQTDHYHPQCGLPLVNYLEMPTLSTYVFENHDRIDEEGRLAPPMGLTWPNPDWGEEIAGIRDYVAGRHGKNATTPPGVAAELERLAKSSLDALGQVRPHIGEINERKRELENTLKLIELNCWFGLHCAEKIRAGVAWESWRTARPGAREEAVLAHLDTSIEHWLKLSDLAWEVFPHPIPFWQSRVPYDPPWDHWDLWLNYAWEQFHQRGMLRIFGRERELVAAQLRGAKEKARLPLFPELDVHPGREETVAVFDFEAGWPEGLKATPAKGDLVELTSKPEHAVDGSRSVLCDTRGSDEEWHNCLKTDPARVKLEPGKVYRVRFDYKVIDPGSAHRTPFAVAARTTAGGHTRDVGSYRLWRGEAGQTGHKVVILEPKEFDDYYLFFCIRGKAAVSIDNIRIDRLIEGE